MEKMLYNGLKSQSKLVKKCIVFVLISLSLFFGCTVGHQVYPNRQPNIPSELPDQGIHFVLQTRDRVVQGSVIIKITGLKYKSGSEGLYYIGIVDSPESEGYIKSVPCSNDDFGIIRATFSSRDLGDYWGENVYIRYEPWGLPPRGPIMTSLYSYKMEEIIITLSSADDFIIVHKNTGL